MGGDGADRREAITRRARCRDVRESHRQVPHTALHRQVQTDLQTSVKKAEERARQHAELDARCCVIADLPSYMQHYTGPFSEPSSAQTRTPTTRPVGHVHFARSRCPEPTTLSEAKQINFDARWLLSLHEITAPTSPEKTNIIRLATEAAYHDDWCNGLWKCRQECYKHATAIKKREALSGRGRTSSQRRARRRSRLSWQHWTNSWLR